MATRPAIKGSAVAAGLAVALLAGCGTGTVGGESSITFGSTAATPSSSTSSLTDSEATTTTAEQASFVRTNDVEYADTYTLDVYAPEAIGPWPVIVAVHGLGQAKRDMGLLSKELAADGAVVYNIKANMFAPFIEGIRQVACAVRFARATAAEHGGDPRRITLVGNSSGAHTGAVVAMAGDEFAGNCVATDGSAEPDVFVGYEGPYDVATTVYGQVDMTPLETEDPELWAAINTYSHIGGNPDLVVRLVHGQDEDFAWYDVTPDTSVALHDALADAGYDVELILVEEAGHGDLSTPTDAFEATVREIQLAATFDP